MKMMIVGIGFFMCFIGTVSAQVSHTNDPTYSPNNYKHANKAAVAKKKFAGTNVKTVQADNSLEANANSLVNGNYKMPHNKINRKNQTIILLPVSDAQNPTNATANPANYKRQNLNIQKAPLPKKEPSVIQKDSTVIE
jgi:hypothetical protein